MVSILRRISSHFSSLLLTFALCNPLWIPCLFFIVDYVLCCIVFQHFAIRCGYHDRAATIGAVLQVYSGSNGRAMIFCETKRDADELALSKDIRQETHVIHGDIPQDKREMVLKVIT